MRPFAAGSERAAARLNGRQKTKSVYSLLRPKMQLSSGSLGELVRRTNELAIDNDERR